MATEGFDNLLLEGNELGKLIASGNEIDVGLVVSSEPVAPVPNRRTTKRKNGNWACKVCQRVFTNSSNLKSHLKIHEGNKKYKCDICGMGFVQHSNLKAHRRIHTGERPYQCKYCDKGFIRSTHLIEHLRIHTGEKPHVCGNCNQCFASSTLLRNHFKRKHKEKPVKEKDPYICRLCNVTFSSRSQLVSHLDFHKSQVKYHCCDCPRYFMNLDDINEHRAKHHKNVKPIICGECFSTFKTMPIFLKHMEDVHPEVVSDEDEDVLPALREDEIKTEAVEEIKEEFTPNMLDDLTLEASNSALQTIPAEPIISSMNADVQHTINILDPAVISTNESNLTLLNSFEAAIVNNNDESSTIEILKSIEEVIEEEIAEERAKNLLKEQNGSSQTVDDSFTFYQN